MSGVKETPCRKFQANIFNKSKCQNCFKPRELHLLTDQDLNQAKPIYGGWLCLAPEGTDFDNPMQRSRKWQRRFFVLYEHGCLRFALDESPSTLPQGTVNMNQCTDVIDAEPKTGQKNALCIITPEQEYFIRGENKEIINGWHEQLIVYPKTNKHNQKKKRKVEHTTSQEPGPAKVPVTGSGIPDAEKVPDSRSGIWQEELHTGEAEAVQGWPPSDSGSLGPALPLGGEVTAAELHSDHGSVNGDEVDRALIQCAACSVCSLIQCAACSVCSLIQSEKNSLRKYPLCLRHRSTMIEKLEALELENAERMEVEEESGRSAARQGRSETRRCPREPDLLNFKKGWMVKLDDQGQWKKYWFVLTDHSLRYYKDSIAEEASDLDGEIDLTTCYSVTEYQVQRNYGFQIHTQEAVYTLSAMTAGIRRNWIQAVMKNVRPSTAPDVASLPDDCGSITPLDSLLKPDVTHDSPSSEASSAERDPGQKRSRARERRREGRSKTFDWAEFRPIAQAMAKQRTCGVDALQLDPTDLERTKRREERRKRYEVVTGTLEPTAGPAADPSHMDVEGCGASSALERQRKVQDEIEQHWQQVEKTPIREERRVPLASALQAKETAELERLLDSYKKGVEELRAQLESCHQQLADSHYRKLELEAQLSSALEREQHVRSGYISPVSSFLPTASCYTKGELESQKESTGLEAELESQKKRQELISSQAQNLKKKYQETKELLQQQEVKKRSMQAQLGLSLSELSARELSPAKSLNTFISETQGITDAPGELTQTAKRLSIVLQDTEEKLEELQSLISSSPLTVNDLVRLLATYMGDEHRTPGSKTCCQKLYDSLKQQQDLEHEALKQNLAKAGESVREYEARLQSMEGMLGRVQRQKLDNLKSCVALRQMEEHVELSEATVKRLAQEVELLTNENEVLNQRYQEIVNQLTEADREIERLKIELFNQQGGQQYLQVVEELNKLKTKLAEKEADFIDKDFYEQELSKKSQKLQDALMKLEVLGSSLKETEKKLHLKEATLKGLGFQMTEDNDAQLLIEEKECLLKQLAGAEARIADQEKQLEVLEQSREEFESQYRELKFKRAESESMYSQKLLEAEGKIRELEEEIEGLRRSVSGHGCTEKKEGLASSVTDEERIEQVVEKIKLKSAALSKVSEVLEKVDIRVGKVVSELKRYVQSSSSSLELSEKERKLLLEGEFWGNMLNNLEELKANELTGSFLCEMAENAFVEKKMLLLAHGLIHLGDTEVKNKEDLLNLYNWLDNDTDNVVRKGLIQILQRKVSLLTHIASAIQSSSDDELVALGLRLFDGLDFRSQKEPWLASLQDAVLQAQLSYLICRLDVQHDKELSKLKETEPGAIEGEPIDSLDKAIQLQDMAAKHKRELREVKDAYELEAEKLRQEIGKAGEILRLKSEENVKEIDSLTVCMENLKTKHETELKRQQEKSLADRHSLEQRFENEMEKLKAELHGSGGAEENKPRSMLLLKERIQELESQVTAMKAEMEDRKREGDVSSLQQKYEKDLENLKILKSIQLNPDSATPAKKCNGLTARSNMKTSRIFSTVKNRTSFNFGLHTDALVKKDVLLMQRGLPTAQMCRCITFSLCRFPFFRCHENKRAHFSKISLKEYSSLQDGMQMWFCEKPQVSQCCSDGREGSSIPKPGQTVRAYIRCLFCHIHEEFGYVVWDQMTRDVVWTCFRFIVPISRTFKAASELYILCCISATFTHPVYLNSTGWADSFVSLRMVAWHTFCSSRGVFLWAHSSRCCLEPESGCYHPMQATCERGFAAMEESHQKVIEELQRKHQRELENLKEEKERLLAEETAATIAAIEAMKNAHRTELERELDKARKANSNTENADIEEIRLQHEEELASFQREIEVLSEQYSQKCLENAHLAQALEAERQALRQCQRENQELNAHNQELNNRLAAEITKLRSMVTSEDGGDSCTLIHGKEVYELEVMLRVKESEVQYLKQEINSLKDELQTAQRDKKYATDKYKDIYTELSIVKAKAERDIGRLRDQLQQAHEALGEPSLEDTERSGYDIMKSKSNPDILKMAAAAAKRSERTLRSKSLKEGLTAEQRLHLFDNKETKEF
uniref:Myosin phosphatase Rho interacting protein n=1 Tax=Lepisosteus oculatus TaxID=7918 RepID=W5MY56_LEPOC